MANPLAAFALAALLVLVPVAKRSAPPGWTEAEDTYRARLESIANDVGGIARNRFEAALLIGVLVHESAAAPDVDAGNCYRVGRWAPRCDGGRAVSMWQLQDSDPGRREVYRTDRRAAAREALRRMLSSMRRCRALDMPLRLSAYAGGDCRRGHDASRSLSAHVTRALAVQ